MITFAYDETSGFEAFNKDRTKAAMVAGVVYHSGTDKAYSGADRSHERIEAEQRRIANYFKEVCTACGTEFPRAIHEDKTTTWREIAETLPEFIRKGTYRGRELVFLASDGTVKQTPEEGCVPVPRKGFYQLVAVYKSGKDIHPVPGSSDLYDDGFASEQYLNMAERIITKGTFLNPALKDTHKSVAFYIPTRIMPFSEAVSANREYRKAGYEQKNITDEEGGVNSYWRIMDQGRAAQIVKEKEDEIGSIVPKSITTASIDYDKLVFDHVFFYLSDALCGFLSYDLKEAFLKSVIEDRKTNRALSDEDVRGLDMIKVLHETASQEYQDIERERFGGRELTLMCEKATGLDLNEEYAAEIRRRMRMLNDPRRNLFYYYDDADSYHEKAEIALLHGDVADALSHIYFGKRLKGYVKKYYSRKWFPLTEKAAAEACRGRIFEETLEKTRQIRVGDNISQGLLLYLFETLKKCAPAADISPQTEYRLYDLGISAYTHVGDSKRAAECFAECMKRAEYVEEAEVKLSKIRMLTVCNDSFRFKEAEDMAAETLDLRADRVSVIMPPAPDRRTGIGKIAAMLREVFRKNAQEPAEGPGLEIRLLDSLAPPSMRATSFKGWSSLGQVYAFERADEEAEECFLRVLEPLGKKKEENYYITLSYLLQFYIEQGAREKYEAWAPEFFYGETGLKKQLHKLIRTEIRAATARKRQREPVRTFKYALYVFIKAFYRFYKEDPREQDTLRELTHLEDAVRENVSKNVPADIVNAFLKGHPWEIIYKYAALLEAYDTNPGAAYRAENRRMIRESVKDGKDLIIELIIDYGDVEYKRQRSALHPEEERYRADYERSVRRLWERMLERGYPVEIDEPTLQNREKKLGQCFTYMYH